MADAKISTKNILSDKIDSLLNQNGINAQKVPK